MVDDVVSAWDTAALLPIIGRRAACSPTGRGGATAFGGDAIATNRALATSCELLATTWSARSTVVSQDPPSASAPRGSQAGTRDREALTPCSKTHARSHDSISTKGGGVVTVVAQDARTGAVLMVAHADREALERTIATGEMHYRSRTRGLWHKGATSGQRAAVVSLTPDCDGDACSRA